ncbi:S24 family peptidase [Castellaniella ginsengisoli]|uniref:S24 family peptidase n=1 Tax=Castellaniella ginsengisoli TaxID=546114 RepID=A0AB39ER63_9BURK
MDDTDTRNRRARLRELIAHCFDGRDAALLDFIEKRTGKRPNQGEISGLQKDDGPRSFGDKKAKTLTEQIGLNRYWFDMRPGARLEQDQWLLPAFVPRLLGDPSDLLGDDEHGFTLREPQPQVEYIGSAPSQRLVAVVGQARLGENGWYDVVQEVGCDGFVEAVSNDPDAYALRVLGDSMFPAIRNGWYVVVEPNHALNPSDFVAVALTDGRKMVKEFLYRTADEVGLQSVNGNKRLTVPLAEIATMHPIGSLVSPGKYRSAT